jgi:hypothetical protein
VDHHQAAQSGGNWKDIGGAIAAFEGMHIEGLGNGCG